MTKPKFLCEPHDSLYHSWHFDAPWGRANNNGCHVHLVPCVGIHYVRENLESGLTDPIVEKIDDSHGRIVGSRFLERIFYGNPVISPGQMSGLTCRFNTRDPNKAQNAVNVLDGGNREDGALSSLWLLGWGLRTLWVATTTGKVQSHLCDISIVVQDWRYVFRLANINTQKAEIDFAKMMQKMVERFPSCWNPEFLRPMFYANSSIMKMLRDQGMSEPKFRGIPIREVIELTETEDVVY